MKKALIAVNPFPPGPGPGWARIAGFIGLLRNYGWEPVILTREYSPADVPGNPVGPEIPEGIDIYRTRPWELDELPGILGRAGRGLGRRLLAPDKERLWEIFSCRKAAKIVKYEGIDLIFTSSPPKSSHLLGAYLKKRFPQIPWIADIRAELLADRGGAGLCHGGFKAAAERRVDRRVCEKADSIVSDSDGIIKAVLENSRARDIGERCFIIRDGYAEELSGVFEKSCRLLAARRLSGRAG